MKQQVLLYRIQGKKSISIILIHKTNYIILSSIIFISKYLAIVPWQIANFIIGFRYNTCYIIFMQLVTYPT